MEAINISIGGEDRPFLYCWDAIKKYSRMENLSVIDTLSHLDLQGVNLDQWTNLIYCCFEYGAKFEKKEIDFEIEKIGEWIFEDIEVIKKIQDAILQQIPKNQKAPTKGQKKSAPMK